MLVLVSARRLRRVTEEYEARLEELQQQMDAAAAAAAEREADLRRQLHEQRTANEKLTADLKEARDIALEAAEVEAMIGRLGEMKEKYESRIRNLKLKLDDARTTIRSLTSHTTLTTIQMDPATEINPEADKPSKPLHQAPKPVDESADSDWLEPLPDL